MLNQRCAGARTRTRAPGIAALGLSFSSAGSMTVQDHTHSYEPTTAHLGGLVWGKSSRSVQCRERFRHRKRAKPTTCRTATNEVAF
jgi:hypothetical protein